MKVQSNSIVFMDTTDTTKIDVHIGVNHPTVQIYDINKETYTPDWSQDKLILTPTVYADGTVVTNVLDSFKWVKIQGVETSETELTTTEKILEISENDLNQSLGTIRYKFYAKYNGKDFSNEITFALTVTGKDGTDGYTPQKGVDYFDGIDGKDGTSVTIEGVAYSDTTPITGNSINLYSDPVTHNDQTKILGTSTGESYLVDGYLCVYNTTDKNFICTGKIQGAKGEKGDSSYLFVRYAEDANGKNMSTSSDGKTYIGFYRSSVDVAPTNPSLITWTKFVGTPASLVTITPSALYFKSTEGKNGTFTPDYIYLYPRFQTVTFSKWEYSVDGGITWTTVNNASGSGVAVVTHNSVPNTLRISRSSPFYTDTVTTISFRCLSSNAAIYDTVSVTKIYDVVDLKIGGRNLARHTDSENWMSYRSAALSFSEGTRSKRIRAVCNATDTATGAVFGIQQSTPSQLMKLKSGQEYTLSFLIRGNIPNLNYTYLMNTGTTNQNIQGIDAKSISETDFTKITKTFIANDYADLSIGSYLMISYIGPTDTSLWFEIEEVQLEAGQVATDWSPSPEDILDSAANVNVMLSNEAHFFEADSKGIPTATSLVLDVVGFKGSIQSPTKIGTITGLPSAGMTATVSNNDTTNTKITIAVTTALTSAIADYGTLTIPITVNSHTINKVFSWSKAKAGATGATGVGVKSTTVWYGVSDSASTRPADALWQSTIPTVEEGKYLWTRTIIDYTDDSVPDTVTYTYAKQGVKGDTGSSGSSVTVNSIQYQAGTSATTAPTSNWSNSIVSVTEGNYLWTKTTFSDGKVAYGVAKQGVSGRGISKITEYYLATTASSGVTTSTSGWTPTIQSVTSTNKYLWNYEVVLYTDNTSSSTAPVIIGVFGNTGATGKGINSVAERYLATESSSGVTTSTTGWTPEIQTLTATKRYLWNYEIITYTDGTTSTINPVIIGVYGDKGDKGDVGRGVSSIAEQYYQSTSATSQTGGSWSTAVPTWADGKYIWTRSVITYTDSTTSTTSPICITGQKGGTGVGVSSVDVWYYQSTSATALSGGSWSTTAPTWSDGKYVWTKTITTYTNSTTDETTAVCITGQKGATGVGVKSVTEYYLATSSSSGVTTSTSGWTTTVQTITLDKKYLWNYEVITYTNDTTSTTVPIIIGVFGNTGKGIKSVTEYYLATSSSSGVTTSTSGWKDTMQALTPANKYLWNYELITYTDNSTATINPVIIGVYGDQGIQGPKGNDAYTVMLTNESHIFAGDVSNAIAGSTTTQVLAYNGSTAQTVTIVSVNNKTAATTDTDTGIAGLKFKCSTLSGASPTITFTCTTSFVSKSGTIPIVLSVGGVSFTKMFTYSIAFKGTSGNPGSPGTPASLVDITPSALYFKSTIGKDGAFTPDYIYLYPRFQTVAYSKWEYSTNGGTSWTTVTSGSNGLTIGTYNSVAYSLQIAKSSALYTDTVTSISFRCVSSNASVYDTVSIAKIYDVVDLQIGGTNLLPQSKMDQQPTTWYQNNAFVMVTEDGYNCAKLTSGIGTSKTPYVSIFDKLDTINLAQEYTISAWVKVVNYVAGTTNPYLALYIDGKKTSDNSWMGVTNVKGNGSLSAYNNQGWKKIEWTIKFAELFSEMKFFVYSRDCTGDLFIRNIKMEKGNKASDWSPAPEDLNNITFQIYAPNGHLLTNELQSLTLQTFVYEGSIEITSGATFQWSQLIDNTWIAISGATGTTLAVTKSDVLRAKSYRCVMTYKSKEYISTITVQDKTDAYNSIMCISSNAKGSDCYWVLYTLVYSDTGEVDPLLGPISINAPTSPVNGDYWYAVDGTNATVQLKKYNGTSWANSTDKQSLTYLWNIVDNGSLKTPIGGANKVQVISCHDFTATATLTCDVSNEADGVLTQSSLSITDASDPIVSTTEPTNAVDGQIWIKPNTNGAYNMFLWSESAKAWIPSDMDTRNKVYTSKPSSYNKGDIWITESDTAHSKYKEGTLLQSSKDNTTYSENDWSATLKYDKDIGDIQEKLAGLSEYVTITSLGLRIGAVSSGGELSPFTSLFTSTELAFYQNSEKLLTLANNQLTAPRVVVEEDLEVQGTITLGGLQLVKETNGSFSFAVTK